MRFSLPDLLIAIACIAAGNFAAGWLLGHPSARPSQLLAVPLGVLIFLLVTPPIYRRFPHAAAVSPSVPALQEASAGVLESGIKMASRACKVWSLPAAC
jgi:hypothetical protein